MGNQLVPAVYLCLQFTVYSLQLHVMIMPFLSLWYGKYEWVLHILPFDEFDLLLLWETFEITQQNQMKLNNKIEQTIQSIRTCNSQTQITFKLRLQLVTRLDYTSY